MIGSRCFGPWGSSIVLAAKPHQEHVIDIKDFVWRMCVSYRKLNSVTKSVETYNTIAQAFADDDKELRPAAYEPSLFYTSDDPTKIGKEAHLPEQDPRIFTNAFIETYKCKEHALPTSTPPAI